MSGAILAGGGDHGVASMEGLGGEGNPALRAGFQAPEAEPCATRLCGRLQ
jgi:hypothetical protein